MAGSPCPVEVMKQVNNKLDMPQACVSRKFTSYKYALLYGL